MFSLSTRIAIGAAFAFGATAGAYAAHLADEKITTIEKVFVEKRQDLISAKAFQVAVTHQIQLKATFEAIIPRIPRYVTPKQDASYPISNGFVLVHDASASGVELPLSNPTAEFNDKASDVKASEAATVIAENHRACLQTRQELDDLQEWVKEQQQVGGESGRHKVLPKPSDGDNSTP